MTKAPGWSEARLDEIAEVRLGRQRSPDKAHGDNLVPYLRAANVRWAGLDLSDVKSMQFSPEEVETFRLRRDDILVVEASGSRDEVGKSALWREELPLVCLQNTLIRVRPRDGVDPEFLRWHLHLDASTGDLGGASKGIGIHHIGAARLASWVVSVPPRKEQRRIVAKLDTIFEQTRAAKARLERLPALLDKLKRSILAAAFRGDLTADWRAGHPDVEPASALLDRIRSERRRAWERDLITKGKDPKKVIYQAPPGADTDALQSLPSTWTWASIDEIATKVVDGVHKKPNYVASGVPFLTVRNLTAGPGISFDDVSYVTQFDHAEFIRRTNPERDDILVSKDGTLGVVRRVETDTVFSIFVSVALIKPVMREVSPFLEQALRSPQVQAQMVGVGSGLQHIHLQDLRGDCIPLAPLDEQVVLVRRVDDLLRIVDAMTARCEQTLDRAVSLEQGALTKAFRGELVEQDPSDEPASVLLDRLRSSIEVQPRTTRQPSPTKRAPRLSRPQRGSSVEK